MRIRKNYQDPQVIEEGNTIEVMIGPVPGTFRERLKGGYIMTPEGWSKEKAWPIAEAARFAKKYAEKYPKASLIKLQIMLPSIGFGPYRKHRWNYSKSTRRLWVRPANRPTTAYFTDKIDDWNAFIKESRQPHPR